MYLFITIICLMILLLLGSPVVLAIGSAELLYFLLKPGVSLGNYVHKFATGMDSFIFIAIPLFVMAGEIMGKTKMTDRIVQFSQLIVGRYKGGLAYVNVLASMLFGGITGAALADVSALGPIEISLMKEDGYDVAFASSLTATSAIQGPIIPPSIPMILFASLTNVSIGAMFLGGIIPGILIGVGQMTVVFLLSKRRPFPQTKPSFNKKEIINICKEALFPLMMPLIIIGGIVGGIFTPTEAAAVAVGYALFVSIFIYRNINFSLFREVLFNTARVTSSIYLIIGFAMVMSWIFAIERVPSMLSSFLGAMNIPNTYLLYLISIFFLINGMWISDTLQIILFSAVFTPILAKLGVHPVHFGVVMVLSIMIGLITPPYGVALYMASAIGNVPLKKVVKETLPFIAVSVFVLFVIITFPQIVLIIPRYIGLIR